MSLKGAESEKRKCHYHGQMGKGEPGCGHTCLHKMMRHNQHAELG